MALYVIRSAASECDVQELLCIDLGELETGFYIEFEIQGMILEADFSHLRMCVYVTDLIESQLLDGNWGFLELSSGKNQRRLSSSLGTRAA